MISPRDRLLSCQPLPKSSPAAVHYGRTLIAAVGGEVQVGIIHATTKTSEINAGQ
jgi:hypothetical protein